MFLLKLGNAQRALEVHGKSLHHKKLYFWQSIYLQYVIYYGVSTKHAPFLLILFVSSFIFIHIHSYSNIYIFIFQGNAWNAIKSHLYQVPICQCLYLCSQFFKNFLKSFLIALKTLYVDRNYQNFFNWTANAQN